MTNKEEFKKLLLELVDDFAEEVVKVDKYNYSRNSEYFTFEQFILFLETGELREQ